MPFTTPLTLEDLWKRTEIGSRDFNEAVLHIAGLVAKAFAPVAEAPAETKPAPAAKKASK